MHRQAEQKSKKRDITHPLDGRRGRFVFSDVPCNALASCGVINRGFPTVDAGNVASPFVSFVTPELLVFIDVGVSINNAVSGFVAGRLDLLTPADSSSRKFTNISENDCNIKIISISAICSTTFYN